MASFLEKASIPIAASEKHKFPLHCGHITTGNFMRFDIANARELAPNTTFKFNFQTFIRTIALKKPLLSSVHVHSTAFFVPFRVVWEPFTDFISDTPHNQPSGTSIIANTPLLTNGTVFRLFMGDSRYASPVTSGAFDFYDGTDKYKFTAFGRWAYSLLVQLGYKFSALLPDTYSRSCLPLLCAAKAFIDWYYPNGYAHYGSFAYIDGILQRQVTYSLTQTELDEIFKAIYRVAYNPDYFVDAFDNPSGPNANVGSVNFSIIDVNEVNSPGNYVGVRQDSNNGTPVVEMTHNDFLSQYTLRSLHALQDYCTRHQLAGSRALERYLADWGIPLSADKLKRSIKLEETKFPFQIGEVMSSSDTIGVDSSSGGAQLGDYAGRAVAYDGNLNLEFSTDEFGYFIVVSTIIPDVGYVQGFSKFTDHKTKLDFLTGKFDGLGTQPIKQDELFVGLKRASSPSNLFAFTGRYAEYKTARDTLSGSFLFDSVNGGLLGWETMRKFSDKESDSTFNVAHSLDFMLGDDAIQYNRIFIDDQSEEDGFILVHRANFELVQPAVPLYDMFDWEDINKKRIELQVNGTKTN